MIMDCGTRPTRKVQEVEDSTGHVTSLQIVLLPLDNSEISKTSESTFQKGRICRADINKMVVFKCRWLRNAAKLSLIRIPMVSFNVSVMFSKITLSYTSLGLLTSSRSPSLKLPFFYEMALQRRRTVDVQPAYGLSSWSRTTTAPSNCQDYAQSGAQTEVYIILYVAEVTNSVRKMSGIYLGTAQRAKPKQIKEKYPETGTCREFAFPTSITETIQSPCMLSCYFWPQPLRCSWWKLLQSRKAGCWQIFLALQSC